VPGAAGRLEAVHGVNIVAARAFHNDIVPAGGVGLSALGTVEVPKGIIYLGIPLS
jgi:hypothetical protein